MSKDRDATTSNEAGDLACGGTFEELARTIDAYEALGFDDVIVGLEPITERSLERLVEALRPVERDGRGIP